MATGTVKWFNKTKGYGFIEVPGKGDVFFHVTELEKNGISDVKEGTKVSFEEKINKKKGKTEATDIKVL